MPDRDLFLLHSEDQKLGSLLMTQNTAPQSSAIRLNTIVMIPAIIPAIANPFPRFSP